MSDRLEETINSMYGGGVTTSDISTHLSEIYGQQVSEGTLSNVTNRILEHIKDWQNRPLLS